MQQQHTPLQFTLTDEITSFYDYSITFRFINSKVGVLAACPQCHINGSLHMNIWAQSTLSSSLLCLTDLLPEKHSQTQTRDTRTSDRTL